VFISFSSAKSIIGNEGTNFPLSVFFINPFPNRELIRSSYSIEEILRISLIFDLSSPLLRRISKFFEFDSLKIKTESEPGSSK